MMKPPVRQRGLSLIGLLFWAVVIGFGALIGMKVFPTVNEFYTIQRTVQKVALGPAASVAEVRTAFDKQKEIEYSISSISGKDLDVTKENDKVVIHFAYDKEIEIMEPVYLLIKYQGRSK
jgi:Domain of unknown function (DUF4845)